MKRYLAFLRGVNISGKNKIPMAELKKDFEKLDFRNIKTYLNSGNVIFSSNEEDKGRLTNQIETMITNQFGLNIPVFVISQEELKDILCHVPDWWNNDHKNLYDNLIFILPPTTFAEVFNEIGKPKEEFEKIKNYKEAIFWSFSRKDYQKTNWWKKTTSVKSSNRLTIRTANTIRKIVEL